MSGINGNRKSLLNTLQYQQNFNDLVIEEFVANTSKKGTDIAISHIGDSLFSVKIRQANNRLKQT
jgi:pyruvate carboxylase